MKVFDKCLLNIAKTIPIYYEGTLWKALKHAKNNFNSLEKYFISAS